MYYCLIQKCKYLPPFDKGFKTKVDKNADPVFSFPV